MRELKALVNAAFVRFPVNGDGFRLVEMAFSIAAGIVLDLYGCMLNLIVVFQKILNTTKHCVVIVWRYNLYV